MQLTQAFETHIVHNKVYHAAAYKHVPSHGAEPKVCCSYEYPRDLLSRD